MHGVSYFCFYHNCNSFRWVGLNESDCFSTTCCHAASASVLLASHSPVIHISNAPWQLPTNQWISRLDRGQVAWVSLPQQHNHPSLTLHRPLAHPNVPSITCTAPLIDSCTPFLTCAALLPLPHSNPCPSQPMSHLCASSRTCMAYARSPTQHFSYTHMHSRTTF